MHRTFDGAAPIQHLPVVITKQPTTVDHDNRTNQRFPVLEILLQQTLPMIARRPGNPGIAVARQIHQPLVLRQAEEINQLRSSRAFARAGKITAIHYRIDGAGFSDIGTPGEGDFDPNIGDKLMRLVGAGQKTGVGKDRHIRDWAVDPAFRRTYQCDPGTSGQSFQERFRVKCAGAASLARLLTTAGDENGMQKTDRSSRKNSRRRLTRSIAPVFLLSGLTLLLPTFAIAEGDPGKGQAKALTCSACHGQDGNSINPEWPNLAGQHEKYIVKALRSYKDGTRDVVLMASQVASLSEQDMEDVAAYFSAQTLARQTADPALVKQGERIYRGGDVDRGISACIACHGPTGRGNRAAGYPSLAGQHATYTANQLLAYRANTRQTDADVDQVMRNVSALLNEAEIKAVASYIQGLQ